MSTIEAFCTLEQQDTPHGYYIDHDGHWVLVCQSPANLVKACHACVGGVEHDDDKHGETEFRAHHIDPEHHRGEVYEGTCQHFQKFTATSLDEVKKQLRAHKKLNDRRGIPPAPCRHRFSDVTADVVSSRCDFCGKTHAEAIRGEAAPA